MYFILNENRFCTKNRSFEFRMEIKVFGRISTKCNGRRYRLDRGQWTYSKSVLFEGDVKLIHC